MDFVFSSADFAIADSESCETNFCDVTAHADKLVYHEGQDDHVLNPACSIRTIKHLGAAPEGLLVCS